MSDLSIAILAFAIAAAVTVGCSPIVINVLRRLPLMDVANHRSSHTGTVLRGGGIAVVIGTATAIALASLALDSVSREVWLVVILSAAFAIVGFIDDLRTLPALARLAAQFALSAIFVLVLPVDGGEWIVAAIAMAWLVLFVNSFNFMDGINGISGATGFLLASGLTITALRWGSADQAIVGASLAGASLGFLPANFPNARVFLGDVGSYLIGAGLATLAIVLLIDGGPVLPVLLPFSLYVADVLFAMLRRLRRGENILKSHRSHVYQQLANGGLGHVRTTLLVFAATAALVMLGQVAGSGSSQVQVAVIALAGTLILGYLGSPSYLLRRTLEPFPHQERARS